jgi:hypothetical protein
MVRVALRLLLCYQVSYGARRPRDAMPLVVLRQITIPPLRASETDDHISTTGREVL